MAINSNKLTKKNIDAVLKFLPVFEQDRHRFSGQHFPEESKNEIIDHTYCNYSREVEEFEKVLYEEGFIIDFEWPRWQNQAEQFYSNPELLKTADIGVLQKLLTTHIRKERFCDGHLACMLTNGHISAILHRLKEIGNKMVDGQYETI